LIEQYVVSYAPSAAVFYYCSNKQTAVGSNFLGLALGDVAIGNFSGLPGTELEVSQLAALYPDMISKSEAEFSETYLKGHAKDQNYIHMATHGVLNKEQPLYSYLLMTSTEQDDGRLTVDEIFSMELQTKFVTLSACETALGEISEGDDLVGLSRAFIYAGSPGVIVSLWKVDDATTAWLMTRFHQYIHAGYNTAESLTYAQRDIIQRNFSPSRSRGLKNIELAVPIEEVTINRNNKTSRDPYYWAPFVVIGNGFIK
jgi:CHAT domain-containing protein